MSHQSVTKEFFQEIEKRNYEEIIKFFSPNAMIHSPLYGSTEATYFYKEFLTDVKNVKIKIKNFFESSDKPNTAAALIGITLALKNDKTMDVECVDIFEFSPNKDKIQSIKIIYDTKKTHPELSKIRGD